MKSIEYYDKKIKKYREKVANAASPKKERYQKRLEKYIGKRNIIEGAHGTTTTPSLSTGWIIALSVVGGLMLLIGIVVVIASQKRDDRRIGVGKGGHLSMMSRESLDSLPAEAEQAAHEQQQAAAPPSLPAPALLSATREVPSAQEMATLAEEVEKTAREAYRKSRLRQRKPGGDFLEEWGRGVFRTPTS